MRGWGEWGKRGEEDRGQAPPAGRLWGMLIAADVSLLQLALEQVAEDAGCTNAHLMMDCVQ